jgi:hypothetical protein
MEATTRPHGCANSWCKGLGLTRIRFLEAAIHATSDSTNCVNFCTQPLVARSFAQASAFETYFLQLKISIGDCTKSLTHISDPRKYYCIRTSLNRFHVSILACVYIKLKIWQSKQGSSWYPHRKSHQEMCQLPFSFLIIHAWWWVPRGRCTGAWRRL